MKQLLPIILLIFTACKKEYSYEAARGVFADSSGQCSRVSTSGAVVPGASASQLRVTLWLNISKIGQYQINSNTQNGIYFSASGRLERTGLQQVQLHAFGVAVADTTSIFTVSFGNSQCTFSIRFATASNNSNPGNPTPPTPIPAESQMEPNTWWFYDSTQGSVRRGRIDSTVSFFETNSLHNRLRFQGWPCRINCNGINMDSVFIVQLYMPQPVVDTGYYPVGNWAAGSNTFQFSNNVMFPGGGSNSFFYFYEASQSQAGFFDFRIRWVRENGKLIRGSFAGRCNWRRNYLDAVGDKRNITGEFLARLR
jgi:hypothetical protein